MAQDKIIKVGDTFKAKANVGFCIPLFTFVEMEDYNNTKLAKLANSNDKEIPDGWFYRSISVGDILTFGDKLVINKITGIIECYPSQIFKTYSTCVVELPCKTQGRINEVFQNILISLPKDMQAEMEKNRELVTARFEIKHMLELIV